MRRTALTLALALAGAALIAPASATPGYFPVQPMLVNVRTSCGPVYDRVVLDISGPLPGHSETWVPKLVYDGSGLPVPLAGGAFVAVALSTAVAHVPDGVNAGLNVYSGPKTQALACTRLRGVAMTGDFEGVVGVGIATDKKRVLKVSSLAGPTRLVLDVS